MAILKFKRFRTALSGALVLAAALAAHAVAGQPGSDRAQETAENSLGLTPTQVLAFKARLSDELSVSIAPGPLVDEVFDGDMIYFLFEFFYHARPARALTLEATDIRGSRLAWTDANRPDRIFFGRNAGDRLFAHALRREAQRQGLDIEQQRIAIELTYSTELLKQLTLLLDHETMLRFVREYFSIEAAKRRPYEDFRNQELARLFSTLIDFPPQTRQTMRLRTMHRQPFGYEKRIGGTIVAGQYFEENQAIEIFDAAFNVTSGLGENLYAHEICHAISAGLPTAVRESFYALSWTRASRGWFSFSSANWIARAGGAGFVSDYAASNEEEDFAESCGAYLTQPELLRSRASSKYSALQNSVFHAIEFNNSFDSSVRARLNAALAEDRAPPRLTLAPADSVTLALREQNGLVVIDARVSGVVDDLSGTWDVRTVVDGQTIYLRRQPDGTWFGSSSVALEISPEQFEVSAISAYDQVSNYASYPVGRTFRPDAALLASIRAARANALPMPNLALDFDRVSIATRQTEAGTIAELTFPTPHHEQFESVDLAFKQAGTDAVVVFRALRTEPSILSRPGAPLRVRVLFPTSVPSGDYALSGVTIKLRREREPRPDGGAIWLFLFEPRPPRNHLKVHLSHPSLPQQERIRENEVIARGRVNEDGSADISVNVPIENFTGAPHDGDATLAGPDGRRYAGQFDGMEGDVARFSFRLAPHFRGGIYSLEAVDLGLNLRGPNPDDASLPNKRSTVGRVQSLFRERVTRRAVELNGTPRQY